MKLKVFDITGREIKVLLNEYRQSGSYEVTIDGSDFSSGVYFYKLESGGFCLDEKNGFSQIKLNDCQVQRKHLISNVLK
ncbi:MAG: T9SS type A sorting domain-containing protein [Ignavibacteria bacterium]|nr:T9SS type A sorting domain-containing protein [Ignavibacteria bacterium]